MKMFYGAYRTVAVLATVCLAAGLALAADTVVEEIVARVNGQVITRSDLRRSREQMMTEARQNSVNESDPRIAQNEKNLLRDLIDQQLLIQKGAELGLTADTDLVKRLDEMRKSMGKSTLEEVEEEAKKQGINWEDFKQNLKNGIITQQVIQREVGGHIQISPEDEKKFYDEHQKDLSQPEQVRLSEILISPQTQQGLSGDEAVAAAQRRAEQALAQIKSGKPFAEVAKEFSGGPTATDGGDLGYFKRGALAKELEDKTFAMKADEVSDVVRTKQGFVILKVTEHQTAGLPTLKQVEPQVDEAIYMQRLQPALREYLTKLREDAFIEVKTGYTDTGASPNQSQPVVVAANAPVATGKEPPKHRKILGIIPR